MAAYALGPDVASEFAGVIFGVSTKVTSGEVDAWLDEETSFINGEIQNKYVVPVTGDVALDRMQILKRINVLLVAHRVAKKLKIKSGEVETSQGGIARRPKSRRDEALQMLDRVKTGLLILEGAPLATAADGVRSFSVDAGLVHEFQRGRDDW